MKKLRAKIQALSLSSGSGTFSGTGHRLGGDEPKAPPPSASPARAPQQRSHPPTGSTGSTGSSREAPRPPPPPAATSESCAVAAPQPPPQPALQPSLAAALPPLVAVDAPEAVQAAVAQLSSDPHAHQSALVLSRLFSNIVSSPGEGKYRKIRLSNPKIQAAVVDSAGGVELLQACGFAIVFEQTAAAAEDRNGQPGSSSADGGALLEQQRQHADEEEGYAVLPQHEGLVALQAALELLVPLLPPPAQPAPGLPAAAAAPPAAASAGAPASAAAGGPPRERPERQWEGPRERNTRVILPASVESDLPQWFFERTGIELKAAFKASQQRREAEQVLMTKAARERLRAKSAGPTPAFAVVKVRLPEGISVQGEFGAGEPTAAVFGWLAGTLTDALQTYELVLPDRRPLETGSALGRPHSVREAGLLPAVTLNLRWTGHSAAVMKTRPALREELLKAAGQDR